MTRTKIERRNLRLGRSGHGISPHVTIALPDEILVGLRAAADAAGVTLSAHIRRVLYLGLDAAARDGGRGERS